jgi:hypothetical protein
MNMTPFNRKSLKKLEEDKRVVSVSYKGNVVDIQIEDSSLINKILNEEFDIQIE